MNQQAIDFTFFGSDFQRDHDQKRLTGQLKAIHEYLKSGEWRTLREIEHATGAPSPSCSAQIRNLRKPSFGSHTVLRRRRGDPSNGLFEYRLVVKSDE